MFPHRSHRAFVALLTLTVSLVLLGLLVMLLPQSTLAQSQPEALGSLRGTIRNGQGDPLPNITVYIYQFRTSGAFRTVTSDSDGVYEFHSLPSGTYTLRFFDSSKTYAAKYYVGADFPIDAATVIVNGNDVTGVDMTLHRAGTLSVTLQSTAAITGSYFEVRLYRQTQVGKWLTFENYFPESPVRHIRVEGLPSGSYRLCATLNDYYTYYMSTECFENRVPDDVNELAPDATDIHVEAGQEYPITIDFDDVSQIEGMILSPDGTPLSDIAVLLYQENSFNSHIVVTDAGGRFRFSFVPRGMYRLLFNALLYESSEYLQLYYPNTVYANAAESIPIDADTRISVTQRLRFSARITGKVTLPEDVPVSYAYFSLFREQTAGNYVPYEQCFYTCVPYTEYDSTTGAYTITQLISGNYRIGVNYNIPSTQGYMFEFYGGDALEDADTITLNPGATQPNIDFEVGEHEFDGVIAGRVTAAGQPLPDIEVGVFLPSTPYDNHSATPLFSTRTDAGGRYVLEGLTASYYNIGARDPSGTYATTFYNEQPVPEQIVPPTVPGASIWHTGTGTIDNIDIELTPGATMRGHVRLQGKPPGDVTVQAVPRLEIFPDPNYAPPVAYSDVRTDANGYYEITGLISGTYYLRAYELEGYWDYLGTPIFYPGTYDVYATSPITISTGQTLDNVDFWYYPNPTYYVPVVVNGAASPADIDQGEPTPPTSASDR